MRNSVYFTTIKSKYHERNEDSHSIGNNYIIVADGMGGESNGDVASKIAVDTISHILTKRLTSGQDDNLKELMFSAIKQADKNISQYVDDHPESYGMGTTVLLMVYKEHSVSIAWCGDSHCYVYRDGKLSSITKDHSYVQELIDAKKISIAESYSHPDNNLITRFVGGGEQTCNPDFVDHQVNDSEIIVLCSDGLSGYCKDADIEFVITKNKDVSSLPSKLKDLAIEHGSDDDITIITFSANTNEGEIKHSSILDWFRRK